MPGCNDHVASHGLCQMHAQRFRRHGDANAGRPDGWGSGAKHPLYERWKGMRRIAKHSGGNVPAWDNFWQFVQDVGDLPSPSHRLYRIDSEKPFGPGNFRWRELVQEGILTASDREAKNAYMRNWTRQRPHLRKALYLKKHYGVTLEWYERKFSEQNGVCAICRKPERRIDYRTKEPFFLAVDHDHKTGEPRDLLCSFCNHGLGCFDDDATLMRAAIEYLERHAVAGAFQCVAVDNAPNLP
jgi:hypothetical protein